MSLAFIRYDSTPTYVALSSDIVDSKIEGASIVGGTVLTTDDGNWYLIEGDLNLSPYSLPISLNGNISIGQVSQGSASLTEKWLTKVDYPEEMAKLDLHDGQYGAVITDEQHYKVHTGLLWQTSHYQSGISSSDVINIGIITGTKEINISTRMDVSGNATYEIFKDVQFSGGGSLQIFNHNFSVIGSPESSFVVNPTITNPGSSIRKSFIPGGSGKSVGSTTSLGKEFILRTNSKYIIKYTNIDGNSSIMDFVADFYEED